jgi:hypothetical protein
MPRERTTWNHGEIAKRAGLSKKADPYTMNQDHPQPTADAYVTGDPSSFAEDVHPSAGTWKAEYSSGQVKRNEIGMPEYRGDTFNHKEKTASEVRAARIQKAALCIQVAKAILPKTASQATVEDQALTFMSMDDVALADTYTRLAQEQQGDEDDDSQQDESQKQAQEQGQEQQKQDDEGKGKQPPWLAKKDAQDQQQQQKQDGDDEGKGKQPPWLAKKDAQDQQGQAQQDQGQDDQQKKQAQQEVVAQMQMQIANLQQQLAQFQQGVPPQQTQADDAAVIDQMLAQDSGQDPIADMGIQLDGPSMDFGQEPAADPMLQQLFANEEIQQAQDSQQQQKQAAAVRTASTRTVGTRPTQGVTALGNLPSVTGSKKDVASISSMWSTAPDVREAFGLPTR